MAVRIMAVRPDASTWLARGPRQGVRRRGLRIRRDIFAPVHDGNGPFIGGKLVEKVSAAFRYAAFKAGDPCPRFRASAMAEKNFERRLKMLERERP